MTGGGTAGPAPPARGREKESEIAREPGGESQSPEPTSAGPPPALVRALRHLLRPLVRLLLQNQITFPVFSNLLKGVYLDVAERDFALEGKRQTASRLSLLTGLHRKDVKRLREPADPDYAPPPGVSLGARLVGRWIGSPELIDDAGRPIRLHRTAREGSASFDDLVASVSTDIRPRAVLDEWLRLGVVELDGDDRVRLRVDAFVPAKGFDEKAHYLGRNLHDHAAAAARNLAGEEPPLLERSVHYTELSPESVAELSELAEKKAMEALREVNRRALALKRRDARRGEHKLRMNFGTYFYRAEMEDPAPEDGDEDA